jgi:AcrR family transcriptional regulator
MSIYYHYPSKAHLFDGMVAHCLGKIDWLPDHTPWRKALRHGFASFRQVAHQYPAFNQYLVVYRMNSLEGLGMLEKILGILRRAGFSEEEAAKYFRLTGYYIMGATLDETSGYAKGPSTAEPVPDEVVARDFPTVASVAPFFKPGGFDATFFAGLDLLLDGIEAAHKNQPKSPV